MRKIGFIFAMLAAIAVSADYMATKADGFRMRDVGEVWFQLHSNSLQLAQPAIERHVSQVLWDPYIVTLLTWPLALVLAIISAALLLFGRIVIGRPVERIYPD